MPFNHYRYDLETQQFMPQYTYGAVNDDTTDDDGNTDVNSDRGGNDVDNNTTVVAAAVVTDRSKQRNLLRMTVLAMVSVAVIVWMGRSGAAGMLSSTATADVAPGTTPGSPFSNFNSWKQWGQGLNNYWSQKADEWSTMKDDLVAKNATKDEIQDAHDQFWADSKKDFAYIPDQQSSSKTDSDGQ